MDQPNGLVRRLKLCFAIKGRTKVVDEIINTGFTYELDASDLISEEFLETVVVRNSIPTNKIVLKVLSLYLINKSNPNFLIFGENIDCFNFIKNTSHAIDAALILKEADELTYNLLMKKYFSNKHLTLKCLKTLAVLSSTYQPTKYIQKTSAKDYFKLLEMVGLTSLNTALDLSNDFYQFKSELMEAPLTSRDHANLNIICFKFILNIFQGKKSIYK